MAASVLEAVQTRAHQVLLAAGTAAGSRVSRGRPDAFSPDEVPAINVRRTTSQTEAFGTNADRSVFEFELDLHTRGDDWETTTDALHMQADQAMKADAQLATLCKGLRCIRTEMKGEPGDQTLGRLTATYQAQALVRPADLTKQVN